MQMMMNDPPTFEEVFFEELTYDQRLAAVVVILAALRKNSQEGGSFRNFLYKTLRLAPDAYIPAWEAGGQDITNCLDGEQWMADRKSGKFPI